MRCLFTDDGLSEKNDSMRRVKCCRKNCNRVGHSPYPRERIISNDDCNGLPFRYELGSWLAVFLEVFWTERRLRFVRWLLGIKTRCRCPERERELNAIGAEGLPMHWPAVG